MRRFIKLMFQLASTLIGAVFGLLLLIGDRDTIFVTGFAWFLVGMGVISVILYLILGLIQHAEDSK